MPTFAILAVSFTVIAGFIVFSVWGCDDRTADVCERGYEDNDDAIEPWDWEDDGDRMTRAWD